MTGSLGVLVAGTITGGQGAFSNSLIAGWTSSDSLRHPLLNTQNMHDL